MFGLLTGSHHGDRRSSHRYTVPNGAMARPTERWIAQQDAGSPSGMPVRPAGCRFAN